MNIEVRGQCTGERLLRFPSTTAPNSPAVIDFSAMTFATPIALVTAIAFAEHAIASGSPEVVFRKPVDRDVEVYLSRMRLGQHLRRLGVAHNLKPVQENHTGNVLLELTQFSAVDGVNALAIHVRNKIVATNPKAANALYRAINEFSNIVLDHSGARVGYVAAQDFRQDGTRKTWFAVADSGQGFYAALKKRGARSSKHALELAVQGGVSSADGQGRGFSIRTLSSEIGGLKGELRIVSGNALRTQRGQRPAIYKEETAKVIGSFIEGVIPLG